MKSSTYLNWFRRLLILGAVVAGIAAPAAGAAVETRDSGSVAATHSTPLGVAADGLRLQAIAQAYQSSANGPTPQGLKADGLRLQGIAQAYKQSQSVAVPDVFERYATAHPYGVGTGTAPVTDRLVDDSFRDAAKSPAPVVDRIVDDSFRDAAKSPAPVVDRIVDDSFRDAAKSSAPVVDRIVDDSFRDAAKAPATPSFSLGVPLEYLAQPAPSSGGNGFDWADWGIGIGSGVGIMLLLAGGLVGGMQRRHRMQTA